MVEDNAGNLSNREITDIGLTLYTFKRTSQFQSFVISFLVGLKAQKDELAQLNKIYLKLDTNGDGFLDADELVVGMHEVRANLFELLDRDPDWQNLM